MAHTGVDPPVAPPRLCEAMLQSRPALPGRLSVVTTPVAVPGPAFLVEMVKPTVDPAETVLGVSAVLRTDTFGHCTMTVADDVPEPSLVDVTFAVLSMVAQLSLVVPDVTCTLGGVTPPAVGGLVVGRLE